MRKSCLPAIVFLILATLACPAQVKQTGWTTNRDPALARAALGIGTNEIADASSIAGNGADLVLGAPGATGLSTDGGALTNMNGILNCRQWGMAGDGVTDDTAAFQAIVDAAAAGNKTIFVPKPTSQYLISDSIVIPTTVRIYGEAPQYSHTHHFKFTPTDRPFLLATNDAASGTVLEGISMAGPGRTTASTAIKFASVGVPGAQNDLVFSRVMITTFGTGIVCSNVGNMTLTRVLVTSSHLGFDIAGGVAFSVQMTGCGTGGQPHTGYYFRQGTITLQSSDCNATNTSMKLGLGASVLSINNNFEHPVSVGTNGVYDVTSGASSLTIIGGRTASNNDGYSIGVGDGGNVKLLQAGLGVTKGGIPIISYSPYYQQITMLDVQPGLQAYVTNFVYGVVTTVRSRPIEIASAGLNGTLSASGTLTNYLGVNWISSLYNNPSDRWYYYIKGPRTTSFGTILVDLFQYGRDLSEGRLNGGNTIVSYNWPFLKINASNTINAVQLQMNAVDKWQILVRQSASGNATQPGDLLFYSYATGTHTHQFGTNGTLTTTSNMVSGGDFVATNNVRIVNGTLILSTNLTDPSDSATPVGWFGVTGTNGASYRVPLYQ